jgi:Delta24-sterol reductase
MHARVMYHALHKSRLAQSNIIQDVGVPYARANEFVVYLDTSLSLYPLWLCPLSQTGKSQDSPYGLPAAKLDPESPEMLLNFGV